MVEENQHLVTRQDRGNVTYLSLNRPQLAIEFEEIMVEENQHLVTRQDRGNVTYLSLNRPQQGNSLLLATMEALHNRLLALRSETSIGVIVLSGVGQRIFCAGHDLKEFTAETDPNFFKTVSMRCSAILQAVREQPQIVIARVEGFASAAGCQLVASADLAIPSNGEICYVGPETRTVVPDPRDCTGA